MLVARSGMEISILALIFFFVVFITGMQTRAKERRERLRIIEEAIRSGNLEPQAQDELVQELTGRRIRRHDLQPRPAWNPSRLLFGLGWLGLFVGVGVLIVGGVIGEDEALAAGGIISAISFGVMSLPMAMRELDRKGQNVRT
jgi:hypothetical protein